MPGRSTRSARPSSRIVSAETDEPRSRARLRSALWIGSGTFLTCNVLTVQVLAPWLHACNQSAGQADTEVGRFDSTRLLWIRAGTDGVVAVDAARVRAHGVRAADAGRLLLPLLRPRGRRRRRAGAARSRRPRPASRGSLSHGLRSCPGSRAPLAR